jgi:hypothetical protein
VRTVRRRSARDLRHTLLGGATLPFTAGSELARLAGSSDRPLNFGSLDADAIEAEIYAHLDPVRRRIWRQRALLVLVRGALLAALFWAAGAAARFAALPIPEAAPELAAYGAIAVALLVAARQRVTFAEAARVVDRHLDLPQVLGPPVAATLPAADGRLVRRLTLQATQLLRRAESAQVMRAVVPWRDLRLLVGALAAAVLFSYLSTLHLVWPGSVAPDAIADPAADALVDDASTPVPADPTTDAALAALDPQLVDQGLSNQPDGPTQPLAADQAAQQGAQLQDALARRADALSRERDALGGLAAALSDSSVASDAADSIRKGDYQKAASQLADLAKQTQQLSQRARQDLAQRLSAEAPNVAPNDGKLADQMAAAGQQLTSDDPRVQAQALNDLARAVGQAGDRANALGDQSKPFDEAEVPQAGDPSALGQPGTGQPDGAQPDGAAQQDGAAADQAVPGQPGGQGAPGQAEAGGDTTTSAGAGAGAGPGQDGRAAPAGPAANGAQAKIVQLTGRPSADGTSHLDQGADVPLVASNDGTVAEAGAAGGGSAITSPVDVPPESNSVPLEKRQIVRSYFTDPGT